MTHNTGDDPKPGDNPWLVAAANLTGCPWPVAILVIPLPVTVLLVSFALRPRKTLTRTDSTDTAP